MPFRDSKLTLVLKESLGGNSKTIMFCTASMKQDNEEETVSSLKFAQRAKKIVNKAKNNVKRSVAELEALIEILKKEIAMLRAQLKKAGIAFEGNKELDAEMEDVEEPDIDDLQVDEDIGVKYAEMETKYLTLQSKHEEEIDELRRKMEESEKNSAKAQECQELKQQLEEQQQEQASIKEEFVAYRERLEKQIEVYEQAKITNDEEIDQYKKEIERLKKEIDELNEKIAHLEASMASKSTLIETLQAEKAQLNSENREMQQTLSEKVYEVEKQARRQQEAEQ